MSGKQLFFFLLFFGAVNSGQLIFLDEIDSSWIASGYQLNAAGLTNITTSCLNCTIEILALFENGTQNNTNFMISDTFGDVIQSQSLNASNPIYLKGALFINDYSQVPSYSLSFRLILPNETISQNAFNAMAFVINDDNAQTFTATSSGPFGAFAIFTAKPSLWKTSTIGIQPTSQIQAGCEYSLYQGGIPSRSGASKYLVNQFHAGNSGNLSFLSFIPAYAATVYVPPNCPFSVEVEDFTKSYSQISTIKINSAPRTGFIMSRNYPGAMDGEGNSGMNIDLKYALSTQIFGNRTAQFIINVDNYYHAPGSPQLTLFYDDTVGYIFNSTTTNFTDSRNATSFRIKFTPGDSTFSNLLLHFSTQVFDMPTTTTMAATNTPRTNATNTTPSTNTTITNTTPRTNITTTTTTTTATTTTTTTTTNGVQQLQIFTSIMLCLCFILKIQ